MRLAADDARTVDRRLVAAFLNEMLVDSSSCIWLNQPLLMPWRYESFHATYHTSGLDTTISDFCCLLEVPTWKYQVWWLYEVHTTNWFYGVPTWNSLPNELQYSDNTKEDSVETKQQFRIFWCVILIGNYNGEYFYQLYVFCNCFSKSSFSDSNPVWNWKYQVGIHKLKPLTWRNC